MGSIGYCRKRSANGTSIADGVNQSAEKMVKVLNEINDTQKTTEREKLEVQTRHFQEKLRYKRERDIVAMENARISQEHARLGLMNQTMVVQAISNLASAISWSIAPPVTSTAGPASTSTEPPIAPPPDGTDFGDAPM
ncbi:hypothetical protein M758_UG228200 [Ceratodon purpureus]|nr:hypothetical protein M758_UG228200 [Ceratodon purpureus]